MRTRRYLWTVQAARPACTVAVFHHLRADASYAYPPTLLVLYTRLAHSHTHTLVFINTFQLPQGAGLTSFITDPLLLARLSYSLVSFRLFVARVLVSLSTVLSLLSNLPFSLPCNNLGTEFKLAPFATSNLLLRRKFLCNGSLDSVDVDTARYGGPSPAP